jgi:spectinomycin phosphotransferase
MLEKLDLDEARIAASLQADFGLRNVQIAFLPLGVDPDAAVYRAVSADGAAYFVKLRRGAFDETGAALAWFLSRQGIEAIIPPLATRAGPLWTTLDAFTLIVYPFVEGRDGYEAGLSDRHWAALGAALKRIHALAAPLELARRIPRESFSPHWRDLVRSFLARIETEPPIDPVAEKLARFLKARRSVVSDLVERTERLAGLLRARGLAPVICHADLHAGNVLIGPDEALFIVDWDSPILAPRERDLMFAGAGLFGPQRTPAEEERLCYQGYGPAPIDPAALAYYRYERIIDDIAVFCQDLWLTAGGGADREQAFRYLASNFLPNNTIEIAYRSDKTAGMR